MNGQKIDQKSPWCGDDGGTPVRAIASAQRAAGRLEQAVVTEPGRADRQCWSQRSSFPPQRQGRPCCRNRIAALVSGLRRSSLAIRRAIICIAVRLIRSTILPP